MHQKEINSISEHKSLSVLIHQDGLSFYIHTSNDIIEVIERKFKHTANPIEILKSVENCFETEMSLKGEFDNVKLTYHHSIFAVIPSSVFQEERAADYLKYNTKLLQTDTISIDDPIKGLDAQLVYIAYSNINNFFYDTYGDYSYFHYSTHSMTTLLKLGNGMYLEIMPSHFYLTVIENDALIAHNIFPYDQVEDILYYALFATAQYKLDPETIQLTVIQEKNDSSLFDLLFTYIRNVEFLDDYSNYKKQVLCA